MKPNRNRTINVAKHFMFIFSVFIVSNSVEKLGQAWGSFIITIRLQSVVPKFRHDECYNMLSIAHRSVSTSECKAVSRLLRFHVPISWIFSMLSFHTQPQPLNWFVEVYEPFTIHIFSKLMTWDSSLLWSCRTEGTISNAENIWIYSKYYYYYYLLIG